MSDQEPKPPFNRADPIGEHRSFSMTETRMAIAGHPIHAMMVAFPIALCICTLGADAAYWFTADSFWPRVGYWTTLVAFVMGVAAGIVGTLELLLVPGIRIRSTSWSHFILAVMLISIMGVNFAIRLQSQSAMILPWGFATSALAALLTALTGWHGGKLVFDYGLGVERTPYQSDQEPDHGNGS